MTRVGSRFEDYVADLLSKMGFRILDRRIKVNVNGVEVGEVDLLAEDECGNRYTVEVKSGKVDVNGIRQAYVNARLMNAKPLVVARGFSNDSSKELARELNVRVIELEEAVVLRAEELDVIVERAIANVLEEFSNALWALLSRGDEVSSDLLGAIAVCGDWACVCSKMGIGEGECGDFVNRLRERLGLRNMSLSIIRPIAKLYMLVRNSLKAPERS